MAYQTRIQILGEGYRRHHLQEDSLLCQVLIFRPCIRHCRPFCGAQVGSAPFPCTGFFLYSPPPSSQVRERRLCPSMSRSDQGRGPGGISPMRLGFGAPESSSLCRRGFPALWRGFVRGINYPCFMTSFHGFSRLSSILKPGLSSFSVIEML